VHDVASPIVNTQAEVDGQLEDGKQETESFAFRRKTLSDA
jgi:hypothetical protein